MTLSPDVCTECAGHKYVDVADETPGRSGVYPCEACNGTGVDPMPDVVEPTPDELIELAHSLDALSRAALTQMTDPAVDALIEMAKEERNAS